MLLLFCCLLLYLFVFNVFNWGTQLCGSQVRSTQLHGTEEIQLLAFKKINALLAVLVIEAAGTSSAGIDQLKVTACEH